MELIIKILWLLLPAEVANMSPVIFQWIPIGSQPIDLGLEINGKPLFGPHKTYRGFFVGITSSIIIVYLQKIVYPFMEPYSLINYSKINLLLLGALLGAGALTGDLVKSFFKRRFNIPSGESWVPFDQIDWVIGSLPAASFVTRLDYEIIITSIVVLGLLHPIINLIGHYLKLKKNKF